VASGPRAATALAAGIGVRADFSRIRYAQCWEDADVLVAALAPRPDHTLLSIASAGDNTLALLAQGPQRVVALDLSPAQIACLELRVAAYRRLDYPELLALLGVQPSPRRADFYARCRAHLSLDTQRFWDAHPELIAAGIANEGRFERYLRLFGTRILPLIHSRRVRMDLITPRSPAQRAQFYAAVWNNRRWRALFRIFFSRWVMGRMGRAPEFFRYVQGSVAERLLGRAEYAFTVLDPSTNPYLQWILLGRHGVALPYALRPENFQPIRAHLDRLEWHCMSLERYLQSMPPGTFHGYNLSDIFEYLDLPAYHVLLARLADAAQPGARLVYWNMLAPRRRPEAMAQRLRPLTDLAAALYAQDKAFFYSALVIEEVGD
jgi:S-adenosylmethionine-diacylglycerol 3-amino-3-carboxypropyl transferase